MKSELVLILLLSLVGCILGEICLHYPSTLPLGSNCGGPIPCRKGGFCSHTGICVENIKVGKPCNGPSDVCEAGTTCRGPKDSKVCLATAAPGEACSTSSDEAKPICSPTFNCFNGTCTGGVHGDSCKSSQDCYVVNSFFDSKIPLNCDGGLCVGRTQGQNCSDAFQCAPGFYCSSELFTGTCKPDVTVGNCSDLNPCAFGYYCSKQKSTDLFNTCFPELTKAPGDYCTNDLECKDSKRCHNNYCAKSSSEFCGSDGSCQDEHRCYCNGLPRLTGTGKCEQNPCAKLEKELKTCLNLNCRRAGSFTAPGLCVTNKCKNEFTKFYDCNPASQMTSSLLLVSFLAFISMVSSKIF